ncbi:Putative deoxyribonuclease TATDN2, partial [Araneus ventricosus]
NTSSKSKQHEVFRRQLQIAYDRRLPIVIHCREAEDDTIRILHEILPKNYTFHLHCFTGNWKSAQRWMKEFPSVFIGITNLVTFPSATATHEVAKKLPCDRLLLETDAPYFVPRVVSFPPTFVKIYIVHLEVD